MTETELVSPVSLVPDETQKALEDGIAICLSGGGYRAMLFHTGVLWRLIELGLLNASSHTARLPNGSKKAVGAFERISSVSGGSIISAMLGLQWKRLDASTPDKLLAGYKEKVVRPIRDLAGVTLASKDVTGVLSILKNIILPGSVNDHLAASYDKHLFDNAKLSELPYAPRWVINASNLQSGALWRFSAPYMRDWKVGENTHTSTVSIARAVAASSAFPPVLAPATFSFAHDDFTPDSGGRGAYNLQRPPYTTEVFLADGGVYDNLGLETAYKRYRTLLVSDGGAPFAPKSSVDRNWAGLGSRVIDVVDNQVRALRKRLLINSFQTGARLGAFWDIDSNIEWFAAPGKLPCPFEKTLELASVDTDLGAKSNTLQERLINWGYAICDASVRTHFDTSLPPPAGFPYATTGVG